VTTSECGLNGTGEWEEAEEGAKGNPWGIAGVWNGLCWFLIKPVGMSVAGRSGQILTSLGVNQAQSWLGTLWNAALLQMNLVSMNLD